MATIGEIIQRIQSAYSKGVQSDDSRLSPRHIYSKMLTLRSKLISQEAKKKQRISDWNYQTLPCIEMINVPQHECPCIPPIGCDILRSKFKIPRTLLNLSSNLIKGVSSIDGSVVYSEISLLEKKYKKGNKYTGNKPDYFFNNGYLYITYNRKGPKVVTLTGLFEDPIEAENFISYCEQDCQDCISCDSYFDKEFPLESDMVDTLIEMSVNELIILFNQNIEDITNDSKDSLRENSK